MILIAIDPGCNTGIAVFKNGQLLYSETITDSAGIHAQYRLLSRHLERAKRVYDNQAVTVVCETFRTFSRGVANSAAGLATARLTGFLEGTSLLSGFVFVWQAPALRKPALEDAKKLPHGTEHELSAIAHGLAYLRANVKQVATPSERQLHSEPRNMLG